MTKRTKRLIALAVLLAAGIVSTVTVLNVKGAPAVNPEDYANAASDEPGSELAPLGGGTHSVPGMDLVAKSDVLELYYHPETTEIAVADLRSGKVWYSNPEHRGQDPLATGYFRELMSSQFSISYRSERGLLYSFINYADSIQNGQFTAERIDGGIRVIYTLGDMSVGIDALPKLISRERMEEKILSKVSESDALFFSTKYFPSKSDPNVLERIDASSGRPLTLKRMLEILQKAGYTEEDLNYDNAENGIETVSLADRPRFTIPLEYRIVDDALDVTIPVHKIEENEGYKLRSINLLEYFGAASADEDGYMFVPDGSGALIRLNNGKTNAEVYSQRVYGMDQNDNAFRRFQVAESARLPVFGLKAGDHAWFAEIVEGETYANINADISGRNTSYNNVYASFAVRGEDTLEIYKGTEWEEVEMLTDERVDQNLTVRYTFLSGKDATYSGMARHYRERLEQRGVLKPLTEERDLPLFISLLGAVDKRKTMLGVPYRGIVPMTTFDEASGLADRLHADGVRNIRMRFVGWFNKGMNHTVPSSVKVVGALGSAKDMRELDAKLAEKGGRLYPDVAFQHVFAKNLSFSPAADAARFVTREVAVRTPYDRALNSMNYDLGRYYLMSPSKLPHYVGKFIDAYRKIGIGAVSLRDLGDLLHSDFRVSRLVFREQAENIVREQLARIRDAFPDVLVVGGNAYALSVSDQFVNVPMATSRFTIVDEEVPFLQMVLHGYADYAGRPINLSDEQDLVEHLLKHAELGAAPHFLWSEKPSSNLKFTRFDHLFSTAYADWYDQALEMYRRLNDVFADLRLAKIEEHIRHAAGVVEVRYDNGTSVYVNYTDAPVTVNGVTVEARNFTTGGETR